MNLNDPKEFREISEKMVSSEELDALLERALSLTKKTSLGEEDDPLPTLYVLKAKENNSEKHALEIYVLAQEDFGEFNKRAKYMREIGAKLASKGELVVAIAMTSAAYHAEQKQGQSRSDIPKNLADYSESTEIILAHVLSADERTNVKLSAIKREPARERDTGKILGFCDLEVPEAKMSPLLLRHFFAGYKAGLRHYLKLDEAK